jgi:hypothetical protein
MNKQKFCLSNLYKAMGDWNQFSSQNMDNFLIFIKRHKSYLLKKLKRNKVHEKETQTVQLQLMLERDKVRNRSGCNKMHF